MKKQIIAVFILSAIVALFPLDAGLSHNPMGEFCRDNNMDECLIDYSKVFALWASWFAAVFTILIATLAGIHLCIKGYKLLSSNRNRN